MRVVLTSEAINDLRSIFIWYKENASEKIASKIIFKILERTKQLKLFPESCQVEEDLKPLGRNHRRLVVGNYKVVYRIVEQDVVIDSIYDARQDPKN